MGRKTTEIEFPVTVSGAAYASWGATVSGMARRRGPQRAKPSSSSVRTVGRWVKKAYVEDMKVPAGVVGLSKHSGHAVEPRVCRKKISRSPQDRNIKFLRRGGGVEGGHTHTVYCPYFIAEALADVVGIRMCRGPCLCHF